jgi:hypothetical protein
MNIDMQHGLKLAAWAWTYTMGMDMQHGHGHAAPTGTCLVALCVERLVILHKACFLYKIIYSGETKYKST